MPDTGPIEPTQHKVEGITPSETRTVEGEAGKQVPGKAFELGEAEAGKTAQAGTPTPAEATPQEVTPETLNQNLDRVGSKAETLGKELTNDRFNQLSPGQKTLLKTKLDQFNSSVQGMSKQMGRDYKPHEMKGADNKGIVKTYLGWLTGGQAEIQGVGKQLAAMGPGKISSSDMLRIQAKLNAAERAINFASAVAGKGADFLSKVLQSPV